MKKRFCTFCENETDELHCEIRGKRTIANKKYAASDEKSKGYSHDKTRYQMMEENHVHKEIEKRKQQFYKNRKEKSKSCKRRNWSKIRHRKNKGEFY